MAIRAAKRGGSLKTVVKRATAARIWAIIFKNMPMDEKTLERGLASLP